MKSRSKAWKLIVQEDKVIAEELRVALAEAKPTVEKTGLYYSPDVRDNN